MRPAPWGGKRTSRVAEMLKEQIALILLHKSRDPRLTEVTITDVQMSPDLKVARVYYVARQDLDPDAAQAALDKAQGFVKQEVAREHFLRVMPELHFLPDKGWERAQRVERLLKEAGVEPGSEDQGE
jgi:ribosome-binding factor A